MDGARPVRAPRGTTLTARQWTTEAPLRMLMNNLDPEVAERPDDLVVYGGTGRAARDWRSFDAMVRTLTTLAPDETMLVQSGRPVGVMRTHEWAPRVLIANSNLVPDWATWPEFRRLEHLGLTMYGQMTAGSWIYIGTQGIVQGTYETFAAVAEKRFNGTLAGTLTLTGGCGGMGGAQPLAVTLNDGVCLVVDVDRTRLDRRVEHRYLDAVADDLDDAVAKALDAKANRRAYSLGVVGNAAVVFPELLRRGVEIDIVTDQTSAHDPLSYLPEGISVEDWHDDAERKPEEFTDRARESMAHQVEAMVGFLDRGAEVFDYGNSIRDEARKGGYERAFDFPGFVPAYIRPLFCEGKGPFRWVALSGDPKDIDTTDRAVMDLFPDNDRLQKWMRGAREKIAFQGLPARICWLGYGERDRAGLAFNDLVASGTVSAPIVIGRDHLDCGSVASPYRETESMLDGSDAIADWPLLNALVNTSSGASWVSIHHGGGVGIGRSIHAGQVSLADGTAARRREAGPGAQQRPGDGRHPARRRWLRPRRRRGRRAGRAGADARERARRRSSWGLVADVGQLGVEHPHDVVGLRRHRDAMSAAAQRDDTSGDARVGHDRPRVARPEGRDRAPLVTRDLQGHGGVRHREPVRAEQRTELLPGELPVAGHEHEEEVALTPTHDERLDDVLRPHPPGRGGFLEAADRPVPGHRDLESRRLHGRECARLPGRGHDPQPRLSP